MNKFLDEVFESLQVVAKVVWRCIGVWALIFMIVQCAQTSEEWYTSSNRRFYIFCFACSFGVSMLFLAFVVVFYAPEHPDINTGIPDWLFALHNFLTGHHCHP
jgi:hypothetical protein